MADVLTKEQRHKNMKNIHGKDTKIEIILRKALWAKGYRYRKNYKKLPGNPDIVLTKYKIAIFCDGEFFHGKDWEVLKPRLEKSNNSEFWISKISRNRERDDEVNKRLLFEGWTVIRFWGDDIKKHTDECVKVIEEMIFDRTLENEEYLEKKEANLPLSSFPNIKLMGYEMYKKAYDELELMLEDSMSYSEKEWQRRIYEIICVLYPKYIARFREIEVGTDGRHMKTPDFMLVDSAGFVDILEIKKPDGIKVVSTTEYRNNYVASRDLEGAIVQIEKYIYILNHEGEARVTAIYVRLSIENSGKDYDGDSIANQISFCKNYLAEQTDLKLCDIYQDNGEKETNFDRLEFKRMMDMTALLLMIPLKNMINDVYAKDISRKIITSFRARQEKGEFLPAFVPVPKSRLEKADAAEDDLNDVVWATLRKLLEMTDVLKCKLDKQKSEQANDNFILARKLSELQRDKEKCESDRFANVD